MAANAFAISLVAAAAVISDTYHVLLGSFAVFEHFVTTQARIASSNLLAQVLDQACQIVDIGNVWNEEAVLICHVVHISVVHKTLVVNHM
jgi:hypothetical protein